MRVLLANEQKDFAGGMDRHLRWLAPELRARGYRLDVGRQDPQVGTLPRVLLDERQGRS
jgi:hypothetical protein